MARFPLFEGNYSTRYSNALHAAYHADEYEVLDSRGTLEERVHVTAAKMLEYKNYVDELNDRNKVAQASLDTQETTAQESERDRLLSLLFVLAASGLVALDAAVKAAAQLLDIVIRPYKGIQDLPDDAETASIRGLLEDLRKEENAEAVKTLNLEPILTSLETANNAFAATKAARVSAELLSFKKSCGGAQFFCAPRNCFVCRKNCAKLWAGRPKDMQAIKKSFD